LEFWRCCAGINRARLRVAAQPEVVAFMRLFGLNWFMPYSLAAGCFAIAAYCLYMFVSQSNIFACFGAVLFAAGFFLVGLQLIGFGPRLRQEFDPDHVRGG
jgi:hypothetical protein